MKEFVTAFEATTFEAERESKIAELMKPVEDGGQGKTRAEAEWETRPYGEFTLDGRTMRAYQPGESQLIFMMAATGRGQDNASRFASIINVMMESLRPEDRDYLESRLLTQDPNRQLPPKQVEAIFEHLMGEWFGDPTNESSTSSGSQSTTGDS